MSWLITAIVAVAAMLLVACGSGDGGSAQGGSSATAEPGALPVTITHKFGSTTVNEVPQRVVALGYNDQDTLLALGIVPVAVRYWDGMAPKGEAAGGWAKDLLQGQKPEIYDAENVDPESIAAMRPDLIVATYSGIDKAAYDALSKIAPTIPQKADFPDYQQPWDVTTKEVGAAVGQPAKAAKLVDGINAKTTALADRNPNWKGKSITVATYDGSALSAFSGADPRTRFFTALGFTPNQEINTLAGDKFYTELSLEEARKLDSDVIVWDQLSYAPNGKDTILQQTALANLPAVKENRSVYLTGELEKAFGWQTVLSIGYVLDNIEEPLRQAVGTPS
ncbi:iron-siderophore ABC transporter substrate-binding protein [Gordonia sinesedis]